MLGSDELDLPYVLGRAVFGSGSIHRRNEKAVRFPSFSFLNVCSFYCHSPICLVISLGKFMLYCFVALGLAFQVKLCIPLWICTHYHRSA